MASHKNLDVRRVNSSLVATFANAAPPVIWRFDLERNHSFTLALHGDGQEWELGVTSPKGEFTSVARFPSREDAEEAFVRISAELAKSRGRWALTALKVIGVVLAAFFLLLLLTAIKSASSPVAPPAGQGFSPPPPQGNQDN